MTVDETYIPFYYVTTRQESRVWAFKNDPKPIIVKRRPAMKKVMYTVFFRNTTVLKAVKLHGQKAVTAIWYTQHYLPEMLQECKIKGLMIQHANCIHHIQMILPCATSGWVVAVSRMRNILILPFVSILTFNRCCSSE